MYEVPKIAKVGCERERLQLKLSPNGQSSRCRFFSYAVPSCRPVALQAALRERSCASDHCSSNRVDAVAVESPMNLQASEIAVPSYQRMNELQSAAIFHRIVESFQPRAESLSLSIFESM